MFNCLQSEDILSTILPRVSNLRSTGTHYSYEDINEDIDDINKEIKKLAQSKNDVFVVEHPQFFDSFGKIQDSLLAADGLHFSFEGTRIAVENVESAIIDVQRTRDITMCNNINSHELSSEIQVSATCNSCESVEHLSYANVIKFGEEREQPVIKHSKVTVSRSKDTRKSKPIRKKQTVKGKPKAREVNSIIEEDCKPSNTLQRKREYMRRK